MLKYPNRREAGKILAEALIPYANHKDVVVFALPRGGVPVAYEIAARLHVPLDVFIVRKLGVPGHSELAMGAIAMGNIRVFNDDIIQDMHINESEMHAVIIKEQQELERREKAYRGNRIFPSLNHRVVILVDDGIATGATVRAAIASLKVLNPLKIILAVPVAQKGMCEALSREVDQIVCPMQPEALHSVGAWFDDFSQTEDEEVHQLLNTTKNHI